MVHATTQTVNGKSSATVTSIDNLPDAIFSPRSATAKSWPR